MLHTIHADFYRLFRSKGFWISEILLALNIISGVLLGSTGHVGVETGAKQAVKSASSWTGVGSLINYSSSISMTVLFTLIVVSIILGVDLAQKLYKNNLTSGISRSGFFFAKATVIVAITLGQLLLSYGLAFFLGTLCHGLGTVPDHFVRNFALTFLLQFLCNLAWVSLTTVALYLTHSIVTTFVTYTLGLVALTVPAAIFPKVEILKYLSLNFNYAMTADKTIIQNTAIVAVGFILAFTALGLITFEKQDL